MSTLIIIILKQWNNIRWYNGIIAILPELYAIPIFDGPRVIAIIIISYMMFAIWYMLINVHNPGVLIKNWNVLLYIAH